MASLFQRLRTLVGRRRLDRELDEEMRLHVEDLEARFRADGIDSREARRRALLEFGAIPPLREAARDARRFGLVEDFARDARHAVRMLIRTPGQTAIIVGLLGLGIGASTAIFSVVERVLLRPLPYPGESRVVRVGATNLTSGEMMSFSPRGYWHFAGSNRSFDTFGGYRTLDDAVPLTGDGTALLVEPAGMTVSAFETLQVFPEIGRLPTREEDSPGGPPVVLVGNDLWVSRYGADPAILGRNISLLGSDREVIGVMPAGYDFPTPEIDVWIPLQLDPSSSTFGAHFISAVARLSPGVTIDTAVRDSRSLVARFDEVGYGPSWFEDIFEGGAIVRPLRDQIVGDVRQPLLMVFGTAGLVLLIACSNVANLLLVRAESRRQENAVRIALGSGRARLVRQTFTESAILGLAGGALGVLLAYAGTRVLVSIGPAGIPRLDEIGINGVALAFAVLVSGLAGVLFGLLPAARLGRTSVTAAFRDGNRTATTGHRHRTRNTLVVTQVALAFLLVSSSGLMVRSFQALRAVDPGFSADGLLTFQVWPLPSKYPGPESVAGFYDRLIERIRAVPGVLVAGGVDSLPLTGNDDEFTAVVEEFPPLDDAMAPTFTVRRATPSYFEAMGIPLLEGRTFLTDDHNLRLPSVIISESVKERYWPGASALGKQIEVAERIPMQVVGVVGDVHDTSLDRPANQFLYLPMVDPAGGGVGAMTIAVRTAVDPFSTVRAIRAAISELDGELPMAEVQSMDRVLGDSISRTSFTMSALVIAAVVALFLGSVGIYGMLSFAVSQRIPEIGIRLALGASPATVRRMVLSQGLRLTGAGAFIGLLAAVAFGRVIEGNLYAVSPIDPFTMAAASGIFVVVAFLASFLPAARAGGTAVVQTLRTS